MIKSARGDVTVTLSDGREIVLACTLGAMDQIEQMFDCGFEEALAAMGKPGKGMARNTAKMMSALTYSSSERLSVDDVFAIGVVDLHKLSAGMAAIMDALDDGEESDERSPPGE